MSPLVLHCLTLCSLVAHWKGWSSYVCTYTRDEAVPPTACCSANDTIYTHTVLYNYGKVFHDSLLCTAIRMHTVYNTYVYMHPMCPIVPNVHVITLHSVRAARTVAY